MTDQTSSQDETTSAPATAAETPITFAEFLMTVPPGSQRVCRALFRSVLNVPGKRELKFPPITLACPSPICDHGVRIFRVRRDQPTVSFMKSESIVEDCFVTFICSNCRRSFKTFALRIGRDKSSKRFGEGSVFKYGENPPFGPPTPPLLMKMIGPDAKLFLMGRRCESQGLGIGAMAYYRRVVEHQKNRILERIAKVARQLNWGAERIAVLEAAQKETRFTESLAMVKDALPESLLINGCNPMTLLHGALSQHLHDETEEECLKIAGAVRRVLAELAEKLASALKDDNDLKADLAVLERGRSRDK